MTWIIVLISVLLGFSLSWLSYLFFCHDLNDPNDKGPRAS